MRLQRAFEAEIPALWANARHHALRSNWSLDTETRLLEAASRHGLRSGQLGR